MIKIQTILLTGALCLLSAAALAGCGKNGSESASKPRESITASPEQPSETTSSGNTASGTELPSAEDFSSPATESGTDKTDSSEEQGNGQDVKIIEDKTFAGVTLGDYENVQFTTREIMQNGRTRVEYSLESDGSAVYTFPDAYDYWQFASEVNFVAFRDVNGDGQKDVITSEQYITNTGKEAEAPFSMTRIYLNQGGEFLFAEGLSVSIGNSLDASRSEEYTIDNILSILEEPVYYNFDGKSGWTKGEIESFAFLVKNDVQKDNRESLSRKISYPLNLVRNGEQLQISTPEEFLSRYDDILNLQVIYDVEGSETEDLFWNQYGVMLGTGVIWFAKMQDGSIKIYSIPAEVQYCNPLDVE